MLNKGFDSILLGHCSTLSAGLFGPPVQPSGHILVMVCVNEMGLVCVDQGFWHVLMAT